MSDLETAILDEPLDQSPDDATRDVFTVGYMLLQAGLNSETDAHADWAAWLADHDAEVREQVARDIEAEADQYAGDSAREFAAIFARIARGGDAS